MSSIHDSLEVLTKEEIMENNVKTLQKQLNNDLKSIEYELSGISIYLHDVKEVFNYERRRRLEKEL